MQVYFHHIFDSSIRELYRVNGLYVHENNKIIYYQLIRDDDKKYKIVRNISSWESIKELINYYSIKTYSGLGIKRLNKLEDALIYLRSPVKIIDSLKKKAWLKIDNLGRYKIQFNKLPEIINENIYNETIENY